MVSTFKCTALWLLFLATFPPPSLQLVSVSSWGWRLIPMLFVLLPCQKWGETEAQTHYTSWPRSHRKPLTEQGIEYGSWESQAGTLATELSFLPRSLGQQLAGKWFFHHRYKLRHLPPSPKLLHLTSFSLQVLCFHPLRYKHRERYF